MQLDKTKQTHSIKLNRHKYSKPFSRRKSPAVVVSDVGKTAVPSISTCEVLNLSISCMLSCVIVMSDVCFATLLPSYIDSASHFPHIPYLRKLPLSLERDPAEGSRCSRPALKLAPLVTFDIPLHHRGVIF